MFGWVIGVYWYLQQFLGYIVIPRLNCMGKTWIVNTSETPGHEQVPGVVRTHRCRVPHMEQELLTLQEQLSPPPGFSEIHGFLSYVLQIVVCPFVLFFWPLCCMSFFNVRLMITPLVSSIVSYTCGQTSTTLPTLSSDSFSPY